LRRVALFVLATNAVTALALAVAVAIDSEPLTILAVLAPSGTALVLACRQGSGLRSLLGVAPRPMVLVCALALLPVLGLVSCAVTGVRPMAVTFGVDTVIVVVVIALGEELGWRGYAYPLLRTRFRAWGAGLCLGLLWALWHVAGAVVGVGVAEGAGPLLFTGWVVAVSLLMAAFLEMAPRSTWYAIALHVGANLTFAGVRVTPDAAGSPTPLAVLASLTALVATVGLVRSGRSERPTSTRLAKGESHRK
jgi:membrane protease YdiL (CAAX protease family)